MKWFCCVFLVASIGGCAASSGVESQVPAEPAARQALDAALTAWKEGQPPGTLTDQSPHVQVVDSMRRPGQRLVGYEILGEVASQRQRGFLVRLRLDHPSETSKVRFCVVGIDPLWVFRQEELDMLGRWMCAAPEENAPEKNAPEKNAPEKSAPQKNVPQNSPEKNAPASNEEKKQ